MWQSGYSQLMRFTASAVLVAFIMLILEPAALAARTLHEEQQQQTQAVRDQHHGLEHALRGLERALDKIHRENSAGDTELAALRTQLPALDAQIRADFDAVAAHIRNKNLPVLILERHTQAVADYQREQQTLLDNLEALDKAKGKTQRQQAAGKALGHLKKFHRQRHAPFDPAQLPFSIPKGDIRAPKQTPSELKQVVPTDPVNLASNTLSPLMLAQAKTPQPNDLEETPEVQFSDDILALAESLDHHPVKLYSWVRDNIRYIPTYGSIQSAQQTLETRAGNAFDTASLLIALLRASGIHARYQYGTARIDIKRVMNWVGGVSSPETAVQLLAQGGIPVTSVKQQGGAIKYVKIEHIWVKAWIDMLPSRGARHQQGDTWTALDASFKQYAFSDGMDLTNAVPFDAQGFADRLLQDSNAVINESEGWVQNLDHDFIQSELAEYQTRIEQHLTQLTETRPDATLGDVIGSQTIISENRTLLARSLPYPAMEGNSFVRMPESLRHNLTIKLYDSANAQSTDSPALVHNLALSELANRRLGLTYVPATPDDAQVLAAYADAETLPVYLVKLKPVLKLDDGELAAGHVTGMGETQYYTLLLKDPETVHRITGTLTAGSEVVFGINGSSMGPLPVQKRLASVPEPTAAENLHQVALHYWLESDVFMDMLARIVGARQFRLPSAGLFSSPLEVESLFGMPRNGSYRARAMDIKHARLAAVAADDQTRLAFMQQAGILSSYLEGSIFEQLFKLQPVAVSTAHILETAHLEDIPVFTISSANLSSALPLLVVDDALKQTLRHAVDSGHTVVIPQQAVTIGDYTGSGYVVYDPLTGSGAYMIDGGFNGGKQETCAGSTEPQVGVIDPVVILLFPPSDDSAEASYNIGVLPLNDLWCNMLIPLLYQGVVAVPLPPAIGLGIILIIILALILRAMQESGLDRTTIDTRRCLSSCKEKFPYHRLCDELLIEYDYMYGSEDEAISYLNTYGRCSAPLKHKNTNPATSGPCNVYENNGLAAGTHSVYICQGGFAASIGCCPCCIENWGEPYLDERCSILNSTVD